MSISGLATRIAIFARWTWAFREKEETSNDGDVLQELCHLHLTGISIPAHVIHDSGERGEGDKHPGCGCGAIIEK